MTKTHNPDYGLLANQSNRKTAMQVLARATLRELEQGFQACGLSDRCEDVRPIETGLVMVRGRIGGDGPIFNVGEATVTRAVVRIGNGTMGVSCVLGRAHKRARLAAIADAFWQSDDTFEAIQCNIIVPTKMRIAREAAHKATQTAATKVDFFTMVRGDD